MIRLNLFMIWFLHFLSLLSVICRYYRQNSSSRIIVVLVYTVSTLFSFDEGQQLSEHTAPFDAVCQILDGEAEIHIAEDVYRLTEGQMLIMPANVPHSVHAVKAFKMLLIMIKG